MNRSASAVINLDLPGRVIPRHVYGHFAEHLGRCVYDGIFVGADSPIPNVRGMRTDVVAALRAIKIPNLRWPGGCFADEYHWRDGIGPQSERVRMVNRLWGDVVEDNSFGTHEFMDLCEMLGAEPYITGNLGSGTVREMADWVEYLTRADGSPMSALRGANGHPEPWPVRFWGLGNEPWGCGGNMPAQYYADQARQYATFLRDHGDNKIYKIAAGPSDDDYQWTQTLMQSLSCLGKCSGSANHFQAISLHYYTFSGEWEDKGHALDFDEADYYLTLKHAQRIGELIRRHSAVMDSYNPCGTVGLVVDEWGTWWEVEPGENPAFLYQQNTMRDALVASVHFDIFHTAERVVMANIAQTVNVLQAMVLTDPATGAMVLTPTYHVFAMNVGHHDAASLGVAWKTPLPTQTVAGTPIPLLSASASAKRDTALVSLSNLDAENAATVSLELRGREVTGYRATVLTAPSLQGHNTPEHPQAVAPTALDAVAKTRTGLSVELPPHSYATVELSLGG
ncbi:MAG: alpha-N-arabinofuranosidase [Propionibacteriaceae bacterium]|jgi:alpha-N-arabinofuranosidase|nr:alpha-N-arabinofuranosidase [Propionibacteriaceae bacterium]